MTKCPDCGRLKAKTVEDVKSGDCPKWWAIRDEMAELDCKRNTQAKAAEPFAYAHPNGAIWRLDNYPAGMDFSRDGWFPLYQSVPPEPSTNPPIKEAAES